MKSKYTQKFAFASQPFSCSRKEIFLSKKNLISSLAKNFQHMSSLTHGFCTVTENLAPTL